MKARMIHVYVQFQVYQKNLIRAYTLESKEQNAQTGKQNMNYYTLWHSLNEIQPCRNVHLRRALRYVKLSPVKCLRPDCATHFTLSIQQFIE